MSEFVLRIEAPLDARGRYIGPKPQPRPRIRIVPLRPGKSTGQAYSPMTPWRKHVRAELRGVKDLPFFAQNVGVTIECDFRLARPRNHYRTGSRADELRADAPRYPVSRGAGDVDNLAKVILDELEGRAFVNDSQVVALLTTKSYAVGPPSVVVTLDEEPVLYPAPEE
ncbi:MAG: RusA family crossover junction endodeoxyribonuclease [Planctomycetota bacterium]